MPGRLRVGVPAHLRALAGATGHGNVWRHTLGALAARPDVELVDGDRRPRLGRRPNAYLGDGHAERGTCPVPLPW